jgi:hypothetical protein
MEVPAQNEKSLLYGQMVDAWQVSVADIGPSGADKGDEENISSRRRVGLGASPTATCTFPRKATGMS